MLIKPIRPFYKYQKRWINDKSRFKLRVKSRQVGGSEDSSFEVVDECVEIPATTWILLSAGERQSLELMEKVQRFRQAAGIVGELESSTFFENTLVKQLMLKFPNRSRIIALPANPDTARGFSGNVFLDEYGFHKDQKKIWQAMYPMITRGFRVAVNSTANGCEGKFYDLAKDLGLTDGSPNESGLVQVGKWSGHHVDIFRAVAEGLPANIDELREGAGDDETWDQEFCCLFVRGDSEWITQEMIAACESLQATLVMPSGIIPARQMFAGYDVGRRRDLSILWFLEPVGTKKITRAVITMAKMKFRDQRAKIDTLMAFVRRMCVDGTGIGMQMGEELAEDYPGQIEPVMFTSASKEDMAVRTKRNFEDVALLIPNDVQVRRSIKSVKKITTAAGNPRFDADRTDKGHADEFWGLSLALLAGDGQVADFAARARTFGTGVTQGLMEATF